MAVAPMSRSSERVNTRHAWIFFSITVIEAIANCALEAVLFWLVATQYDIGTNTQARTIPTYLSIYILAFLFQVVFTLLAINQRNTIQIIGLVCFNASFIIYSAVQINEITETINVKPSVASKMHPILITIPVITGLAEIAYVYLSYKIYQDFGWLIFKRLGADRKTHRYYFYYEIFCCLLKFDFFFFVGFSMQLLVLNIQFSNVEAWLTVAAIPVSIVFIIIAVWSVKHEAHFLQILFDVGVVGGCAYFVVKLWRIWDSSTAPNYADDKKSLTIFACIALCLMVSTFIVSVICQINFGKGLKKYLVPQKSKESTAFVGHELDDDTSYRNSLPPTGKAQRVLLD